MPQIFLALEGKVEFIQATNPFGGGDKKKAGKKDERQQAKLNEQRTKFALMKANARIEAQEKKKNG
jgi:hypothetical protein